MKSMFNNLILYKKSVPALRFYLEVSIFCLFFLVFFFTIGLNYLWPFNYLNIAFYVLLSGLILFWSLNYKNLYFNYYFVLFAFFNIMIIVSSLLNGFFYINTTVLTLSATTFIFSQFIVEKEYRTKVLKIFALAFIAFLVVFSLKNIVQLFSLQQQLDFFGADPNVFSYIFVYSYLVLLYFLLYKRTYFLIPFCLYTILLIFIIGSRSALLLMIICSIAMLFLFFGKRRFYIPIIITVVIILLVVLILSLPIPQLEELKARLIDAFQSIFENGSGDTSSNHRIMMFFYGIDIILKRPFFGYGGIYRFGFYNFSGQISHNNFIEIGFNYGLLTLILYEAFIIYSIYKLFKNKREESHLYINFLICFFLMQFFYPIFTNKIDYFVICFALSAIAKDTTRGKLSIKSKKINLIVEK